MDDLDEKRENFRKYLEKRKEAFDIMFSDMEKLIADYRARVKEHESKDDKETED